MRQQARSSRGHAGRPNRPASSAVIAFLGFDAIATRVDEVDHKRPGSLIGRATLLSIGLMMILFALGGWLLSSLSAGLVLDDPAQSASVVIGARLDWPSIPLALMCAIGLGVGGLVAVHASVSRLLFAMAPDRQLPRGLASVHPRFRTPWVAVLLTGQRSPGSPISLSPTSTCLATWSASEP